MRTITVREWILIFLAVGLYSLHEGLSTGDSTAAVAFTLILIVWAIVVGADVVRRWVGRSTAQRRVETAARQPGAGE